MANKRLMELLDSSRTKYLLLTHSPAHSAQDLAKKTHVHGWEVAKTTILRAGQKYVMAALPAPRHVDLKKVAAFLGVPEVQLATEDEIQLLFRDCELGAMPPFGAIWGLPLLVDVCLAEDVSIVFSAGNHYEAIRMDYADYERLAGPVPIDLSEHEERRGRIDHRPVQ
jgi:Ala-tRNA(Pro) deacylase